MPRTNGTGARGTSSASANAPGGHELDAPPWLRVESTLMATARAIRDAYDSRLEPLGLNLSTASLLAYIADYGPVSQTRAAEHLGQGRAVTGSQIDKLEAGRLVERRPDPNDRRVWLVAVTSAGEQLAADIAEVDEVFRGELRDGISRADRQTLATLLIRLQQNISRPPNRPPDPTQPPDQPPDQPPNRPPDQTPDPSSSTPQVKEAT